MLVFADIVGWIFHVPILTSVIPGFPTMKPNTASALGLLAICCFARVKRCQEKRHPVGWISIGALAAAMVLSGGTLIEYASRKNFGLDNLILTVPLDRFGDPSGRMALGTALCLTFTGVALGALDKAPLLSVSLLLTTNVITISALISFAINTAPLFSVPWLSSLSVPTALCLVMLAVATLVSQPERGPASSPVRSGPSGATWSRLFDNFIVLPLLMAAPSVVAIHPHIPEAMMTILILAVLLYSTETWLQKIRQSRGGGRP